MSPNRPPALCRRPTHPVTGLLSPRAFYRPGPLRCPLTSLIVTGARTDHRPSDADNRRSIVTGLLSPRAFYRPGPLRCPRIDHRPSVADRRTPSRAFYRPGPSIAQVLFGAPESTTGPLSPTDVPPSRAFYRPGPSIAHGPLRCPRIGLRFSFGELSLSSLWSLGNARLLS